MAKQAALTLLAVGVVTEHRMRRSRVSSGVFKVQQTIASMCHKLEMKIEIQFVLILKFVLIKMVPEA